MLGAGFLLAFVLHDGGVSILQECAPVPAQPQDLGDTAPAEGDNPDGGVGPETVGTLQDLLPPTAPPE